MKILLTALLVVSVSVVNADIDPDAHAPIGVMGDHYHKAGEMMFSYRFMYMSMQENLDGKESISPEKLVTSIPNKFSSLPMMPPTLRVAPTKMSMQMHMLGIMYAPNNRVTLMGMVNQIANKMDHVTFAGSMGTKRLANFETKASGLGDLNILGLFKVRESIKSRWHVTTGLSLPTGSIEEEGIILTPMNKTPMVRLPYPMQLGSGTFDLILGLTHARKLRDWGWGGQWKSIVRLNDNNEGYSLGNQHQLTGWLSYHLNERISASTRLSFMHENTIEGRDASVTAPVQTADPDRHGGQRLDIGFGINAVLPKERLRIGIELQAPSFQNLNGPQLSTDWNITLGIQFIP